MQLEMNVCCFRSGHLNVWKERLLKRRLGLKGELSRKIQRSLSSQKHVSARIFSANFEFDTNVSEDEMIK